MNKKITLLTGNERKKKSFEKAISGYPIEVDIQSPWLPEIQAKTNEEVAKYAARYGADLLQCAVVKMDSGFYIDAIDGFPGPFIHYVDKQIGAVNFLPILDILNNLNCEIRNAVAYCEPNKEPIVFSSGCRGVLSKIIKDQSKSFIDNFFIPLHEKNPNRLTLGEIREENYDTFLEIWGDAELQLAKWISNN